MDCDERVSSGIACARRPILEDVSRVEMEPIGSISTSVKV
jgi:hypothetical protein